MAEHSGGIGFLPDEDDLSIPQDEELKDILRSISEYNAELKGNGEAKAFQPEESPPQAYPTAA